MWTVTVAVKNIVHHLVLFILPILVAFMLKTTTTGNIQEENLSSSLLYFLQVSFPPKR